MSVTIFTTDDGPELNMANGNFGTVFRYLELDVDCCGSMTGEALLAALDGVDGKDILRPTVREGNMISCGIQQEQADRYFERLRSIAETAIRNGQPVCWG